MPHDRNGNILQIGDTVMIPCKIVTIQTSDDYCNCNVETIEKMAPEYKYTNNYALNTGMVVKPFINEHGELVVYASQVGQ